MKLLRDVIVTKPVYFSEMLKMGFNEKITYKKVLKLYYLKIWCNKNFTLCEDFAVVFS